MEKRNLLFLVMALLFAFSGMARAESYRIGVEDVLHISVWGNPELTTQAPVKHDGMISIPLVGDVKALDLTPKELRAALEAEIGKYVKTPTVSVIVSAVNSRKVYVLGEGVAQRASSGEITLRRQTTLMQLLAQLGSLKEADLRNAYVIRNGQKMAADFYKLVAKGDSAQDIPLEPNDVIFIPEKPDQRIRVVGAVRTPGIIPYVEGMSALDAVLSAGGFTEFASQNGVVVIRKEENEVTTIEAKLKDVINSSDTGSNVLLKPGDLVNVRTGLF
ncbi:MAG: polysaccharide biosynthesis/export family protein [Alphaproteobacteria bacterium]|uniref:Polysaccharide biosynthesis/export family protein n=1 Tax=Candidatus Nitrobium versatile TaxID=2884831 RepID=A0A953J5S7_9BACT|nr:polysaccharide biosynthesis/export family protein [Candidatus Nitrobium versatile]